MRKALVLAAALLTSGVIAEDVRADTFALDVTHAQVGFRVQHFGVSYLRGAFGEVSGSLEYADDPATMSVEVLIKSGSLITSFDTRTQHALSANFLGVEEHPDITFKSTSFTKGDDGMLHATGDLTIRGTTREVSFPFEMIGPRSDPFGGTRIGVTGALVIDRLDYGLPFNRKMDDGTPLVGTEVEIDLSVEFSKRG